MTQRQAIYVVLVLSLLMLFVGACSNETDPDNPGDTDGDLSDGDAPDGDLPDGDLPDGELPDGDLPDGDLPDGDMPDGDAPDGDVPEDGDAPDGDEPKTVRPECAALVDGWNRDFMVDSKAREFLLHLPTDVETNGPWAVIFNWHGLGDTATNMAGLLSTAVNNTTMPFILVTPEDTGLLPMNGLDWAILQVDQTNADARLFDEILSCLDEKWGVDSDHIHSTGFSAGGIMTDVLGTLRGDLLASTFTFSGAYFSNPVNDAYVGLANWADFTTENKFVQVMIHGGQSDVFNTGLMVINFNTMGNSDVTWFNEQGHDLIHCDHGGGHTVPMGTYPMPIVRFFADHPKGVSDSPYMDEIPDFLPSYCVAQEKN